MAGRTPQDKIRCSFCNKTQDMVRKMISGQDGAYICDECISLCTEILEEEMEDEEVEEVKSSINLFSFGVELYFISQSSDPVNLFNSFLNSSNLKLTNCIVSFVFTSKIMVLVF